MMFAVNSEFWLTLRSGILMAAAVLLIQENHAAASQIQFVPESYSECSYVIDSEGMLLVWGRNQSGELGAGNLVDATTPQRLPLPPGVTNWIAAAGGTSTTFAIDQSGRLFSCGGVPFNNSGHPTMQSNLQFVPFPSGVTQWKEVAAGNSTLLLSDSGAVYVMGSHLPLSNYPQSYLGELVQVPLPTPASHVAAGRSHYLMLGSDGKIYLWGMNDAGQIGQGYASASYYVSNVVTIPFPPGVTNWQRMAAGGFHCLAVGSDNNLYAWGANNFGQLGIGSSVPLVSTSNVVPFPVGVTNWQHLSAGEYTSYALGNNGRIYASGWNPSGILATGSTTNEYKFKEVLRPMGVTNWLALGSGHYHGLALGDDGAIYTWGYNYFGALGNGTAGIAQSQVKPALYRLKIAATNETNIALIADLPSGSNWVVEASSNLQSWSSISSNFVHEARLQVTRPAGGVKEFYRLTRSH
jgi:alpha-tubulin suppressor-like RCC1 family protein